MLRERPTIIPYIMCGDPDTESTLEFLKAMDGHVDAIELGIPFSDPIADGPTIQKAAVRALDSGTTVDDVFDVVSRFRNISDTPVVLMTYYNLIYRRGAGEFLEKAKKSGVNGTIVVDLPLEESEEHIKISRRLGLDTIFLAAPNTDDERMRKIDDASTAFVYLVSHLGTTGARKLLPETTLDLLLKAKEICRKPLAVGFGISTPIHVSKLVANGADAVVVGSELVKIIEERGADAGSYLKEKIISLKEGF